MSMAYQESRPVDLAKQLATFESNIEITSEFEETDDANGDEGHVETTSDGHQSMTQKYSTSNIENIQRATTKIIGKDLTHSKVKGLVNNRKFTKFLDEMVNKNQSDSTQQSGHIELNNPKIDNIFAGKIENKQDEVP